MTLNQERGIISTAIANAASQHAVSSNGKENSSLLEQQSAMKITPAKTQFTFTCEPDPSKGVVWPGPTSVASGGPRLNSFSNTSVSHSMQNQKGFSTQGTQTSPTMAGQPNQKDGQSPGTAQQPASQPGKPRRSPAKQYAIAARHRRLQQEYNNYHHPPKDEDMWICEFCEYEAIFGAPPIALVRQYEVKDRRERKRLAEKRRLLEKAKMKGRKGKKGSKNAAKNNAATNQPQQPANQQNLPQQVVDQIPNRHHGTQSDEYLLDDYDDDPLANGTPSQPPTKIPQPVAQTHTQSLRHRHTHVSSGIAGSTAGRAV